MIDTRVRETERGFTLVELAIVMMIIGLLIGGILKGQELMENARTTSTISAAKSFDAAVTTFRDTYNSWPGDMANALGRLPNCSAATNCVNGGTSDGTIGDNRVGALNNLGGVGWGPVATDERVQFWRHMLAADLISGVTTNGTIAWDEAMPSAPIGGGWRVGHFGGGAPTASIAVTVGAVNVRGGHYLELTGDVNTAANAYAANAGALPLTPSRASVIDRKMDDGVIDAGSVVGFGPGTCATAAVATNPSGYNESVQVKDCGLYIRIQG